VDLKFGNGLFLSHQRSEGKRQAVEKGRAADLSSIFIWAQTCCCQQSFSGGHDVGKQASLGECKGFVTAVRGVLFVAGTIYNYICLCVD